MSKSGQTFGRVSVAGSHFAIVVSNDIPAIIKASVEQ
jgi:hypothetical protein